MNKYQVKFYRGDYSSRQKQANYDQAVAYVEHHFNSSSNPDASCSSVVVATNASKKSKAWAKHYAESINAEFSEVTRVCGPDGVIVGGYDGRGNGNLLYTAMPAILVEPLFASNPEEADLIRSEEGQSRLAKVLVDSIQRFFPDGGLVAFSVGHLYKSSNPYDKGAALHGGGSEGVYAEKVLVKAKDMLEQL